jgi:hypothetical protein
MSQRPRSTNVQRYQTFASLLRLDDFS